MQGLIRNVVFHIWSFPKATLLRPDLNGSNQLMISYCHKFRCALIKLKHMVSQLLLCIVTYDQFHCYYSMISIYLLLYCNCVKSKKVYIMNVKKINEIADNTYYSQYSSRSGLFILRKLFFSENIS